MLQLMFQDRLDWFGKRLTCSCYVAYKGNNKITELRAIIQRKSKLISIYTDKISQQPENFANRNDPNLVQACLKKMVG